MTLLIVRVCSLYYTMNRFISYIVNYYLGTFTYKKDDPQGPSFYMCTVMFSSNLGGSHV